MVTLVGGTFNCLHKGHEKLLKAAYETDDHVIIGLTSDKYVNSNKNIKRSYQKRKYSVENFMKKFTDNFEIHPLDNSYGNTLDVDDAKLVVSPETYSNALRINSERLRLNKKPLRIIKIPFVLAEDLFPISSTRVMNKEITKSGKRKTKIKISISTDNDLKINALNNFLKNYMKNYEITKNLDYKTCSEQPFGNDTIKYATQRALYGLRDNDYSIGVESGIFYNKINNVYYDFHYCAVIDKYSKITTGVSSGFEIPDNVIDFIKSGGYTNEYVEKMYNVKNIGKKNGIIGLISDNKLKRYDLIYESIRNAFLIRLRADLYTQ